ncbi:MAG: hypothetical protein G8345_01590 [Magnetococcales bacterium]|nr:hypothetical protein [Magnetococcales bacterium]
MPYSNPTTKWSALLLFACLASMSGLADGSSQWQSDFGPLSLTVENDVDVSGSYPKFQGTLEGFLSSEGNLEMTWFQPTSEVRCQEKKERTYYWGRVIWQVLPGGILKGKWSYCNATPGSGGKWNAKLVSGAAIEKMVGVHEPPPVPAPTGKRMVSAPTKAAMNASMAPAAMEVKKEEVMEEIRFQWGQNVNLKQVKFMAVDFTCDKVTDQIAVRANLDSPEGHALDLLVITRDGNNRFADVLSVGESNLCVDLTKQLPSVSIEDVGSAGSLNMVGPGVCSRAIRVGGSECSPYYFFWMHKPKGNTHFTYYTP